MLTLERLVKGLNVGGVVADQPVTVIDATPAGPDAVELTYKDTSGRLRSQIMRSDSRTAWSRS